ncbi:hypothetical protein ONS95_004594 [Cadophora gregata]|uniref:uncharacterized protein n=1 Tax=Cadophora gregata TaxID=51156 RepID=UPI0026DAE580|nr:uncharacterized protein ONS95_004594 [Cadophora gregata]KAK0105038.1 hypothetical protein ONS96_004443 [Cadophora gregata f. sp. sojae]KAK0106090.1 hypothetical protein ONS95_004594 [Cadophora gregata]
MLSAKYHILLLGGTGICGTIFLRAALEAGHTLTLYVRTPSKISEDIASNPNIHIIQGEFGDEESLKKAAACGATVFVSLAGPTLGEKKGMPITHALQTLYPHLLANSYTRILTLSTASYSAPEDTRSVKWWVAINMYVRVIGGDAYNEVRGMAQATVDLGEKIKWTVFRVPLLSGKALGDSEGEVEACYVGDKKGRDGLWLDRGRLARWILGELDEGKWIGTCPLVSNA